ncbi:MAG: hypothetical protein QM541_05030 [Flavobacterium sp.]|nr:hypothetical protein [Flavobacterium sp.]
MTEKIKVEQLALHLASKKTTEHNMGGCVLVLVYNEKLLQKKVVASPKFNHYNSFLNPNKIVASAFNATKKEGKNLVVNLLLLLVVVLEPK